MIRDDFYSSSFHIYEPTGIGINAFSTCTTGYATRNIVTPLLAPGSYLDEEAEEIHPNIKIFYQEREDPYQGARPSSPINEREDSYQLHRRCINASVEQAPDQPVHRHLTFRKEGLYSNEEEIYTIPIISKIGNLLFFVPHGGHIKCTVEKLYIRS